MSQSHIVTAQGLAEHYGGHRVAGESSSSQSLFSFRYASMAYDARTAIRARGMALDSAVMTGPGDSAYLRITTCGLNVQGTIRDTIVAKLLGTIGLARMTELGLNDAWAQTVADEVAERLCDSAWIEDSRGNQFDRVGTGY